MAASKPIPTVETLQILLPNIGAENARAIDDELIRAKKWQLTFNSLHEAYAVVFEEVDELWQHCLRKRPERDPEKIRKELIQIAAMAIKALHSMEHFTGN